VSDDDLTVYDLAERVASGREQSRAAYKEIAIELLRVQRDLCNLLARIHRDGGHHTEACGLEKSVADADAAVAMYISAYDARVTAR
jgi:hypothetical protein